MMSARRAQQVLWRSGLGLAPQAADTSRRVDTHASPGTGAATASGRAQPRRSTLAASAYHSLLFCYSRSWWCEHSWPGYHAESSARWMRHAASTGGPRGFDGGKLVTGRKRFILVDTLGMLLGVVVVSAHLSECAGGVLAASVIRPFSAVRAAPRHRGDQALAA